MNGISGIGAYGATSWYSSPKQRPATIENAQDTQKSTGVWTARRSASPETPVQPVDAAKSVSSHGQGTGKLGLPIREGADPVEMSVRMRIRYEEPLPDQDVGSKITGAEKLPSSVNLGTEPAELDPEQAQEPTGAEAAQAAAEEGECQTCKERKYQDDSDDMGVSFQTPTNIAPEQAASAVRGHEQEHVVREQAKAQREGREVVSQNVTIHTDICPECGEAYVSGGTTKTVTKASNADTQQQQQQQQQNEKRTPFSAVA